MFSEYGLIRLRVLVECRWLQHLARMPDVPEVPALGQAADQLLEQLATSFSVADAQEVKDVSTHVFHRDLHWLACPDVPEVPALGHAAQQLLEQLTTSFSIADAQEVRHVSSLSTRHGLQSLSQIASRAWCKDCSFGITDAPGGHARHA